MDLAREHQEVPAYILLTKNLTRRFVQVFDRWKVLQVFGHSNCLCPLTGKE